jgi:hypothetical protein
MAEQEVGSVGNVTESYSAGVVTIQATLTIPANSFGLSGSLSLPVSLNLKTAITAGAAATGNSAIEEVASILGIGLSAT